MARDPVYRQDAPGYLGVVRETEGLRVIVARSNVGDGFYFRLQSRGPRVKASAPAWVPVAGSSAATLATLLEKCASSAPGLRELVAGLPDHPAKAAPWLGAILQERDRASAYPFETRLRPPLC